MESGPQGIINSSSAEKPVSKPKKEKPHVTWDEEQIAEHNKTRG